ncbi:MAG: hypothetical protein WC736_09950 [Gallionella sp.]|jgi:hypothetical protein
MHNALHPDSNSKLTVQQHIQNFGNEPSLGERARCPVCLQRLTTVATSSPNAVGHFAHIRDQGYCPTKSISGAPYAGKPPRNPDIVAAKKMKQLFMLNWKNHFTQLDFLVKGLAIDEFIDVINAANKERIWEYASLEEFQLPYIFATLMDYPPHRSHKKNDGAYSRICWFRCWFDASVQCYDDLWTHRTSPLKFWRAWYKANGKQKPKSEDLIDSYGMALDSVFLTKSTNINPNFENKINAWLNKNFKVD